MTLQEYIHKFEVGEGTKYLRWGTLALLVLALTVTYDLRRFRNFTSSEAMDNAQVARNLAEGKGFSTQFIRPLSMHLVSESRIDRKSLLDDSHPDLANAPVYPALLAGLMKVLPFKFKLAEDTRTRFARYQPEILIAVFNQLLFFAAAALLYFLARRLFDHSVAWLSVVAFLASDLYWRFSVSGLPTLWLINLLLGIVCCLVWMDSTLIQSAEGPDAGESKSGPSGSVAAGNMRTESSPSASVGPASSARISTPRSAILLAVGIGLLLGLGGLTRYAFAWILLPVVVYFALFYPGRRLVLSLSTVAALLVLLVPWLIRNYSLSGTLFGTAGYAIFIDTDPFPGNTLERSLDPDLSKATLDLTVFTRKFLVNFGELIRTDLPKLSGSWLSAFFLVGLLLQFRSPTLSRLRIFLLLLLGCVSLIQPLAKTHLTVESPEVNSENLLALTGPLVLMFGIALFFTLLDQMNFAIQELRYVVTGALVLVAALPLILSLLPPRVSPVAYPPYFPPFLQEAASWMEPDEITMSDMPWAIAWYGDRKSIWLTLNSEKDFYTINDFQKPVKALILTPITTDARFLGDLLKGDRHWGRFVLQTLFRGELPSGFPLKKSFGEYLQQGFLIFIDRERWKKN